MKASEIVTLIGAGFNIKEIKEITDVSSTIELLKGGVKKDDLAEAMALLNTGEVKQEENVKPETEQEDTGKESDIDYKSEYEKLLKSTQAKNVNKDISGEEEDSKTIVENLIRSFM